MKTRQIYLAPLLAGAIVLPVHSETSVTIYSGVEPGDHPLEDIQRNGKPSDLPGFAVIRQEQDLKLAKGRSVIRINEVPALIDPTTVSFESLTDPLGTHVIEQSFEFDLTSTSALLQKYIDREVTIDVARAQGTESVTGQLIGIGDGLVLKMADGSIRTLSSYAGVRLAALPGGLISKPTLVWDLMAEKAGTQRARYGYRTDGMTWWANYNLTLDDDGSKCRFDMSAWVTIVNRTGTAFTDAKLKLVAGDVHRAQPLHRPGMQKVERIEVTGSNYVPGFVEKPFFEYHLYTLGRPATLTNNSTRQIELFPTTRNVACEKTFVYRGQARSYGYSSSPSTERYIGGQSNSKVDVYFQFRNGEDNHMGMPLPAGNVRVSKLDSADHTVEFVGEDMVGHTAKNETVLVKLGSAFDVVGERRQVDYRFDSAAKWIEEEIEVKVRNQKEEAVNVSVYENLNRWSNWSILRKSHDFESVDARTIRFPVKIAKGGEAVVRYTIRYSW